MGAMLSVLTRKLSPKTPTLTKRTSVRPYNLIGYHTLVNESCSVVMMSK